MNDIHDTLGCNMVRFIALKSLQSRLNYHSKLSNLPHILIPFLLFDLLRSRLLLLLLKWKRLQPFMDLVLLILILR